MYYVIDGAEHEDLERRFTYHAPFGDQPQRYEEIRDLAERLAREIAHRCPQSRELSLALTKIEEAVFWANAAIARNESEALERKTLAEANRVTAAATERQPPPAKR